MNFRNSGPVYSASNPYWLKPIRTSIARLLMRCAIKLGTWAETAALWLAPWFAGVRND